MARFALQIFKPFKPTLTLGAETIKSGVSIFSLKNEPEGGSEAITNFEVTDNQGAVIFSIWGTGTQLNLAAGQSGIFTQTSQFNFDSSDQGLFGGFPPTNLEPNNAAGNGNTNLIGGCSSNASFITAAQLAGPCNRLNAPIITFDENGNPESFVDTGFTLNTGEWDFVNNGAFGEMAMSPSTGIPSVGPAVAALRNPPAFYWSAAACSWLQALAASA